MKRLIICMMAVFAIVACSKSDDVETGGGSGAVTPQAEITLYVASLQLSSLEKTEEISFTSTVAWSADVTDGDTWCSISPTNGNAGSAKIVVTTTTNDSYDNREATIVIKAGNVEKSVSVKQAQKNAIVIADDKYDIGAEGGELCFEIQTNVDVEVEISENAIEWISHVETRALEDKTLIFEVQPSSLNDERSGTITIKGDDVEQVIDVVQRIAIPNNEIWYTTSDGATITLNEPNVFGANIISNTYEKGIGVITFDGDVTKIGEFAFVNNSNIQTITFPYSVVEISRRSFAGCNSISHFYGHHVADDNRSIIVDEELIVVAASGLSEYVVPNEVKIIGYTVFINGVNITNITIPDSVTEIQDEAFAGCVSLLEIDIPEGVSTIGSRVFSGCEQLTNITLPNSITTIGTNLCNGCMNLTTFSGKFASSDNRCLIKDGELIVFAPAGLTEYVVPKGVESIAYGVFNSCGKLTKIELPEGLIRIAGGVFNGCKSLTTITIPSSVTTVGQGAFNGCDNLTNFSGKFTSADGRCLVIDGALVAFAPAGVTNYTIPNDVRMIGPNAFYNCEELVHVNFSIGLETIGSNAFGGCSNIKELELPSSITRISDHAFSNCENLTSVSIPNGVTVLEQGTFINCSNLLSVDIPQSVTEIKWQVFDYCDNLDIVLCRAILPPKIGSSCFYKYNTGIRIYVPLESVDAYKTADGWSDYADKIEGYTF